MIILGCEMGVPPSKETPIWEKPSTSTSTQLHHSRLQLHLKLGSGHGAGEVDAIQQRVHLFLRKKLRGDGPGRRSVLGKFQERKRSMEKMQFLAIRILHIRKEKCQNAMFQSTIFTLVKVHGEVSTTSFEPISFQPQAGFLFSAFLYHLQFDRVRVQTLAKGIKIMEKLGISKNSGTPKWMVYNGNPY